MEWIETQINDENIFPVTTDVNFPKTFGTVCKKILTRLYRVFVHVYVHHFDRLMQIGAEPHVNTCYKHFYYFVKEFGLMHDKVTIKIAVLSIFNVILGEKNQTLCVIVNYVFFFKEFEPLKEMTQRICTDVLPMPHPSQSTSHHQKSSTTSATNEFQFSNMK